MRDIVFGLVFTVLILGGINLYFLGETNADTGQEEVDRTVELEREVAELREQLEDQQEREEAKWNDKSWIEDVEFPEEYHIKLNHPTSIDWEVPDYDYGIVDDRYFDEDTKFDMEQQETQQILRDIQRSAQGRGW